jgi:[acyl-carrier-protein] S-malonyltransferase
LLVRQVQNGVRMTDCIRTMGALGLDAILEIGPGKVLSGFVKKTLPGMPVYALETVADLEKLPAFLEDLGKEQTL